jgi:putative phosphoesterase
VRLGLVSDTHGLVDPKLAPLFAGCDAIVHAGDVVRAEILEVLAAIAPLTVVRGNNDVGTAFDHLPEVAFLEVGPLTALVVHDLGPREKPRPPARALLARRRPDLVVHGHSHRPAAAVVGGRLFVNPGSAGPRRFSLPRTAALLVARGRRVRVELVDLAGARPVPFGAPLEVEL